MIRKKIYFLILFLIFITQANVHSKESFFADGVKLFKEKRIGAYNWGFVSGKTNTIYPWKSWDSTYTGPPKKWHHDIFYPSGEPFSYDEVDLIKSLTKSEMPFENRNSRCLSFLEKRMPW